MKSENKNNNRGANIPNSDPSKAMDSKKEVEQSPDNKTDQDFPGYPHYPAREDIMDQRNDITREDIDVEKLPNSKNVTGVNQRFTDGQNRDRADQAALSSPGEDLNIRPGTEADVNSDDLAVLNATNDEIGTPQNVSNEDLENTEAAPSVLDEMEGVDAEDEDELFTNDNHVDDSDRS